MSDKFKALVINQEGENFHREIKTIDKSFLKHGDVLVKVDYSGLNYRSTEELINCSSCFDKIHYSKKSFSENFENPIIFFRKLHKIGANVFANACGPCIGQWEREGAEKEV